MIGFKGLIRSSANWKVENGIEEAVQQQQLLTQALSQSSADRLAQSFQNYLIHQNQQGLHQLHHQPSQHQLVYTPTLSQLPIVQPTSLLQTSGSGSSGNLAMDFETPAVENPEECVLWYYNYFLGKGHQNYLGTDDSGAVFGASIIKEESDYGEISYKTIVWTSEGIERQLIQLKGKQSSLTPHEIIKRTAPKLIIKKLKEVESPEILQDFKDLEATQTELNYKFGVLLARPDQSGEDEFYANQGGSERYEEFLNILGDHVELRNFKGFRGGLDVTNNTTGTHSLYTKHKGYDIMFHVSTMLPFTPGDTQQIERKRHLGNDIVIIIFYDGDTDIIPWDPSNVKSNFNHIFAVVKPDADNQNYHLEFAVRSSIARFGPKLPNPSIFPKGEAFKEFFITKLVNAQRAALQSAPSFTSKLKRTFKAQLEMIYQKHQAQTSSASITSFVTKRRSNSISYIQKGKELKAKEQYKYSSSFIKPNKSNLFDTEILFTKNLNEKIVCLDVIESDELRTTLILATEESIYILKTNMITNESIFQKIININNVLRICVIRPISILLVLTTKGLFHYEMDPLMSSFKAFCTSSSSSTPTSLSLSPVSTSPIRENLMNGLGAGSASSSPSHSSSPNVKGICKEMTSIIGDEPKSKLVAGSKGCTLFGYTKADAQNTNETDITLLYLAIKKTLYLFEWNRGEFQKSKELVLNENIKSLCPVIPGVLCIGVAKEFLLVDMFTQSIKELYKKPNSEPVKALSLENEILLCFNNIGIFVDEKGNKTRSYELKWGSTPSSLALVPSYILGISGALIEVRSLLNGNIIQSLQSDMGNLDLSSSFSNLMMSSQLESTTGEQLNSSGSLITSGTNGDDHEDSGIYTFSTFNDLTHVDNGNIFVASSSKGSSCIIRIKQNTSSLFSPPSSPSISISNPPKDVLNLSTNDLNH